MAGKEGGKKITPKAKPVRFGVFELRIPKLHFPKRKNNQAKAYALKTRDVLEKLHDIELDLEFHLSNIRNAKSILFSKRRATSRPTNLRYLRNLTAEVEKFDNEYQNYCLWVYVYRETIWHFIAEFLDIKYGKFFDFVKDSKIRDTGISGVLESFDKKASPLKDVIDARHRLTHKLSTEKNVREKAIDDIIKRFSLDLRRVNRSLDKIIEIHQRVGERINEHTK